MRYFRLALLVDSGWFGTKNAKDKRGCRLAPPCLAYRSPTRGIDSIDLSRPDCRWLRSTGQLGWLTASAPMTQPTPLLPAEVLADLLGSGDFPAEIADPEATAALILRWLADAGFAVVPADGVRLT